MACAYGTVDFSYPLTRVHVTGPQMDESNSDQMYLTIRLEVESVLNRNLWPAIAADTGAGDVLARIRHYLCQPRLPLYYDIGSAPGTTGTNPIINLPGGRDDAGGPIPDTDAISVTYSTQDTILIKWAVVVKIRDCGSNRTYSPLSLRWEDSVQMDETFRTTYRRRGHLIISSLSNNTIDYYRRNIVAPVCPKTFARLSSSYVISKDGLRCDFEFVDQQIRWAPPYPAVAMEITQSESTAYSGQGERFGALRIAVRGAFNANPRDLIRICSRVAGTRIQAANARTINGTVLGPTVFECTEKNDEAPTALMTVEYRVPVENKRAEMTATSSAWDTFFSGGVIGLGTALGQAYNNRIENNTRAETIQNRPTAAVTANLDWVGAGTWEKFSGWASPTAAINAPADGVLLAPQLALFAALLKDPCGTPQAVNPIAVRTPTTIRTNVRLFNTADGGQGGTTAVYDAQLTASLSALAASEYPTTAGVDRNDGLHTYDGLFGPYTLWQCLNEYDVDEGTTVVPVMNPAGPNVAFRHSSTLVVLRKKWVAERRGSPPMLPSLVQGTNWVLTRWTPALRNVRVDSDGVTMIHRAEGVYEYYALDMAEVNYTADAAPFQFPRAFAGYLNWYDLMTAKKYLGGDKVAPAKLTVPQVDPDVFDVWDGVTVGSSLTPNDAVIAAASAIGSVVGNVLTGQNGPLGSGTLGTPGSGSGGTTGTTFPATTGAIINGVVAALGSISPANGTSTTGSLPIFGTLLPGRAAQGPLGAGTLGPTSPTSGPLPNVPPP